MSGLQRKGIQAVKLKWNFKDPDYWFAKVMGLDLTVWPTGWSLEANYEAKRCCAKGHAPHNQRVILKTWHPKYNEMAPPMEKMSRDAEMWLEKELRKILKGTGKRPNKEGI